MTESNPYDEIWANKLKESDPNSTNPSKWKGLNLLGKILTNLREKLKLELNLNLEQNNEKILEKEVKKKSTLKNRFWLIELKKPVGTGFLLNYFVFNLLTIFLIFNDSSIFIFNMKCKEFLANAIF